MNKNRQQLDQHEQAKNNRVNKQKRKKVWYFGQKLRDGLPKEQCCQNAKMSHLEDDYSEHNEEAYPDHDREREKVGVDIERFVVGHDHVRGWIHFEGEPLWD